MSVCVCVCEFCVCVFVCEYQSNEFLSFHFVLSLCFFSIFVFFHLKMI